MTKRLYLGEISVSYAQVCVFDAIMTQPYNEWLPRHERQGFSWRPGSVSFATVIDRGVCQLEVLLSDEFVHPDRLSLGSALFVVVVPFEVSAGTAVEVGSIMDGRSIEVQAGAHNLTFFDCSDQRIMKVLFSPKGGEVPGVLRARDGVGSVDEFLMTANPG